MSAVALAALILAAAGSARGGEGPSAGAGTTFTAGSGGYKRVSVLGDSQWRIGDYDPYAWLQFGWDSDQRWATLGGGTWRELGEGARVKGGAAVTAGRLRRSDESLSSFTLEAGAEKTFASPTVGGDYRFTSGTIAGPTAVRVQQANPNANSNSGRRTAAANLDPFTSHELSGYGRLPTGRATMGLRLSLILPSRTRRIVAETFSLWVPVSGPLSLSGALTFEQGRTRATYFSLGLHYLFGEAAAASRPEQSQASRGP